VEEQSATISVMQDPNSSIPSLVMKLKAKKKLPRTFTPSTDKNGLVVYMSKDGEIITHIDDDTDQ